MTRRSPLLGALLLPTMVALHLALAAWCAAAAAWYGALFNLASAGVWSLAASFHRRLRRALADRDAARAAVAAAYEEGRRGADLARWRAAAATPSPSFRPRPRPGIDGDYA